MDTKELYQILNKIKLAKNKKDIGAYLALVLSEEDLNKPIPKLIQKYRVSNPNLSILLSQTLIKLRSM